MSQAPENHHRLRELTALREAAEAEKQSLLTRLGRAQMGETIVGADAGLRSVLERVDLVARSAPVPRNPQIQYHLGVVYTGHGRNGEALE